MFWHVNFLLKIEAQCGVAFNSAVPPWRNWATGSPRNSCERCGLARSIDRAISNAFQEDFPVVEMKILSCGY
jgi:hypothetical protein